MNDALDAVPWIIGAVLALAWAVFPFLVLSRLRRIEWTLEEIRKGLSRRADR